MKKYKWHIVYWFCDFWYGFITDKIAEPQTHIVSAVLFFFTHTLFLFYSYLFLLRHITKTKKNIISSIGLFSIDIAFFLCMRYAVRFYIIPKIGIPEPATTDIEVHFTNSAIWIINMFIFCLGYFYFTKSVDKERQLRIAQDEVQEQTIENILLQQKQLQADQQKLQLENTILRAQINPHFLYNTLNFLYAKSLPLSSDLSEGIMKLSDIMRHSLQPQDEQGYVYLNNEVEHVKNIIDINKLRFNNKLCIESSFSYVPADCKIIPLVLITLVENVFKHGDLTTENNPARIVLRMYAENHLQFSTWNLKRSGPKEQSTGIGLNNTIKRLRLAYGDGCKIDVENGVDFYRTELCIIFKNSNKA